jgi:ATP-dependent RNA helicase DeaD
MNSFKESGLRPEIIKAIDEMGFVKPTTIQEKAIPKLLESERDLIGLAQTGTGKTAAFSLPLLHKVDENNKSVQMIVLCPTRELCLQIAKNIKDYSKYLKAINVAAVYGGANISDQIREIKRGAQIIVGTPGRTVDLIKRKRLNLENINWLVLDEADEMLSMGFKEELNEILGATNSEKQVLLFSATMPKQMVKIARKYMKDPIEVSSGDMQVSTTDVKHGYYIVNARDRYEALKRIADINPDIYAIIFCRTRAGTKEVAEKLNADGYSSDAIHGDLSQAQRDYVMNKFKTKQLQLLVATDVAARGVDVNNLTHVINYKLPDENEVYVHRSGRTGRAGNKGISLSIIHSREKNKIRYLEKKIGNEIELLKLPTGEEICEKQLFKLVDKVETIDVNEAEIEKFLPYINKKLNWLSREDLIKHFVSVEFNRFLKYYKDARDLNYTGRSDGRSDGRGERGNRRDRGGRDRGGRNRSGTREGRREGRSRDRRDEGGKRDYQRNENQTRFFINVGSKHKITAGSLMQLINSSMKGKTFDFGKIEIMKPFSFFEVDNDVKKDIVNAFKDTKFKGNKVIVEEAKEKPTGKSSKSKKGKRRKRDRE